MKRTCPCCGFYTVDSDDEVIVDICPVCFWQYDNIAQEKPNDIIGPNHISLNKAKENYRLFGVCEKQYINNVREPFPEELPENNV